MNSTKQILQHVGGGRGIRKTHIIKIIQHFFIKTNNEQKNRIVAYNANVTLLVGGTIIHSLSGLSIKKMPLLINQTQYLIFGQLLICNYG